MIFPSRDFFNWLALIIVSTIGIGISLWGYYQIINIPSLTTLEVKRSQKDILIYSPKMNDQIQNPVKITGRAKSKTGYIVIKLIDKDGLQLGEEKVKVDIENLSFFETTLKYHRPSHSLGLLKVTEYPSKEESPTPTKNILVKFTY